MAGSPNAHGTTHRPRSDPSRSRHKGMPTPRLALLDDHASQTRRRSGSRTCRRSWAKASGQRASSDPTSSASTSCGPSDSEPFVPSQPGQRAVIRAFPRGRLLLPPTLEARRIIPRAVDPVVTHLSPLANGPGWPAWRRMAGPWREDFLCPGEGSLSSWPRHTPLRVVSQGAWPLFHRAPPDQEERISAIRSLRGRPTSSIPTWHYPIRGSLPSWFRPASP